MNNIQSLNDLIQQTSELANSLNIVQLFQDLNLELDEYEKENSKLNEQLVEKNIVIADLTNKLKQNSEDLANMTKVSVMQSLSKQLNEKNIHIQFLESQLDKLRNTISVNNANTNSNLPNSPKLKEELVNNVESPLTPIHTNTNTHTKTQTNTNKETKTKPKPKTEPDDQTEPDEPIQPTQLKKKKKEKSIKLDEEPELVPEPVPSEPSVPVEPEPEENKLVKKKKKKQTVVEEELNQELVSEPLSFDPNNFEDINGYELIVYKKKYYLRDLETNELYDILDNQPNVIVGLISTNGKVKFN